MVGGWWVGGGEVSRLPRGKVGVAKENAQVKLHPSFRPATENATGGGSAHVRSDLGSVVPAREKQAKRKQSVIHSLCLSNRLCNRRCRSSNDTGQSHLIICTHFEQLVKYVNNEARTERRPLVNARS